MVVSDGVASFTGSHAEDTGYFEWVDKFLVENPGYVELSDRMILETGQTWLFCIRLTELVVACHSGMTSLYLTPDMFPQKMYHEFKLHLSTNEIVDTDQALGTFVCPNLHQICLSPTAHVQSRII